ncbi:DUF4240 domain-containing protein [Streptomyces griseiscabiei]|uniref:DUF4240 domain-containing protein n=1 Tax=Streptomyces griseiscabiei TaxID=2993540 RepID=A0ABU4KVV0_9ACTN|nr:DUF4240 domain-containing protein [Streptomyces griseiscabiei]MBZ3903286.1 DUF4240 domain-containing protein [Streptomyces griseiscabiei]MDX2907597.1 DUF4240 domain-containing protein [Streptomyces griseiscabiei]
MNMDEWWGLVDRARAAVGDRADDRDLPDDPLPAALVDVLATLEPAEIVDFYVKYVEVEDSAYHCSLCMAAYVIEGSYSDDGFMDFRGGLILLGRDVFSRAVAHPDSLAGLSTVARMSRGEGGWIGYESVSCLISDAYGRVQGETDSLDTAVATALSGMARPEKPRGEKWNGDPEDEAQLRRRLPRLAALFLD